MGILKNVNFCVFLGCIITHLYPPFIQLIPSHLKAIAHEMKTMCHNFEVDAQPEAVDVQQKRKKVASKGEPATKKVKTGQSPDASDHTPSISQIILDDGTVIKEQADMEKVLMSLMFEKKGKVRENTSVCSSILFFENMTRFSCIDGIGSALSGH